MRTFVWLVRAAVFFSLFAFALNNQEPAVVRFYFGQEWRAPMVFIVLAAFGLGCAFGVFAMVPSWWRHRRIARRESARVPAPVPAPPTPVMSGFDPALTHPPRDGL
ncbi:MAG: LapA family protein [Pseudomonadota bacterium]|nr:LapA family protein [Pseudomonadota bacterium]